MKMRKKTVKRGRGDGDLYLLVVRHNTFLRIVKRSTSIYVSDEFSVENL